MLFTIYGTRIDVPRTVIVAKVGESTLVQFIDTAIRAGWYNIEVVEWHPGYEL
jgi:hypothetical protein